MSSRLLYAAVDNAIFADSKTSVLLAGSTTTVLQLDAADIGKWSIGDPLFFGAKADADPNHWYTCGVTSVNTTLNQITVHTGSATGELAGAPAAGVTIYGGAKDYLTWGSEYRLARVQPQKQWIKELKRDYADPLCVCYIKIATGAPRYFDLDPLDILFRMKSRSGSFINDFYTSVINLFHGRPENLTIPGHGVETLFERRRLYEIENADDTRDGFFMLRASYCKNVS